MESNCCKALMKVAGNTTHYYVCEKCKNPCDPAMKTTHGEMKDVKNLCRWCLDEDCEKDDPHHLDRENKVIFKPEATALIHYLFDLFYETRN